MTVTFQVHGIPRPAGSKRAFAWVRKDADGKPLMRKTKGGKDVAVLGTAVQDTSGEKGKDWRAAVGQAARDAMIRATRAGDAMAPPLEGPLRLVLTFRMPRPKAHLRKDGSVKPTAPGWPAVLPDVDKLSRSVLDACKGIVWRDDAQVVVKSAMKVYTTRTPGCSVDVETLEQAVGREAERARESSDGAAALPPGSAA